MDELGMESFLSIQTTLFKLIFLQHQRFVLETKEREPEILFVGDSLISHLIYTDMWETMFAPLHPVKKKIKKVILFTSYNNSYLPFFLVKFWHWRGPNTTCTLAPI